ncbi:MAG TPA: 1,2-phenylacetyl-CoA epoxidase subunit PaaD [Actinocrinis sp.]|uniref:1,2-phenylacetyl-CoA epoxidase subunit PaaD n=1 Tax=Actinocrinis sp. TaxID=1920516 RepID=UPI002DDD3B94|nr:1,2-phenylacetyl-CoA epoxidase subunit PaaD [Actinocrinis sp.]HEV3173180.1 1,2-phenylacetyl-CoA epoxidase subunit PaaD [Actinocrinis sp.]
MHNPAALEEAAIEPTAVDVVRSVPDPEMPYLTLGDLGVVVEVTADAPDSVHVRLTPTYLGCPATEVIARDVESALRDVGWRHVAVEYCFDPPWTPDRITPEGRRKLAAEGVAPPPARTTGGPVLVQLTTATRVTCPRCGAEETLLLSAFGATPCQELRRCGSCGEPFPAIKAAR